MKEFKNEFLTIQLLDDYTIRIDNLDLSNEKSIELKLTVEPTSEKQKEWKEKLEKRNKPKGKKANWVEEELDEYLFGGPVSANLILNNKRKISKKKINYKEFQDEILDNFRYHDLLYDLQDFNMLKGCLNSSFVETKVIDGEKLVIVLLETKTHFGVIYFHNVYSGYQQEEFWNMYLSVCFLDFSKEEEEKIKKELIERENEEKEYLKNEKLKNDDYSSMINYQYKSCVIKLLDYYQAQIKPKSELDVIGNDIHLEITPNKEKLKEWELIIRKRCRQLLGKTIESIESSEEIEMINLGSPLSAELVLNEKKNLKKIESLDLFAEEKLIENKLNEYSNKKIVMNGAENALLIETEKKKGKPHRDVFIFIETLDYYGYIQIFGCYPDYQKEEFWKIFKSITFNK